MLITATVPLVLALANLVRVTVKELKQEKVRCSKKDSG